MRLSRARKFEGQLISSDQMSTNLQQGDGQHGERTNVDGTWLATVRLPPVPGAPTEVELTGTARGNAEGATTELSFKIDGVRDYSRRDARYARST